MADNALYLKCVEIPCDQLACEIHDNRLELTILEDMSGSIKDDTDGTYDFASITLDRDGALALRDLIERTWLPVIAQSRQTVITLDEETAW